ncbi:hypothetical protein Zmor_021329 [Zophobas morio]|uniref:Cytochrome P450 n=2 Tax=Zophobas morio TaxID=2755281 RepID=A0AA38MAE8_9CUCU|nr:hypothetical protein Zmor_021329 [Zophobas morio]
MSTLDARKEEIKNKYIWQTLEKEGFSDEEIKLCIFCLVKALRKINNTLLFTLYELSIDEEVQTDLRAEVARFKKSNSTVTYQDLSELEYLETVVCEILRKYPTEPFVYKICERDYSKNDVQFPKNMLIFASIFGIHHDDRAYINPELFDPDRFCKENLKFVDSTKYLPFGFKDENDFGILYLKLIVKATLVELLSRFKFSLSKKSPKTIQFNEANFTNLELAEDVWLNLCV